MPVEVTAADTAGMLLKDMLPQVMLRVDTLVSVLAVDTVAMLRGPRADTRVMQAAHIIGMGAVTGEAITGIRLMDILGLAITAWVMVIRITDIIRGDITLTDTDPGRT